MAISLKSSKNHSSYENIVTQIRESWKSPLMFKKKCIMLKKHYYVEFRKMYSEASFTVVLSKKVNVFHIGICRKQVDGCRGVYFPSWPNKTTYINLCFIHGKTQDMYIIVDLTWSLGQKVEPNNLVFLWNCEGKIILNTWFFVPEVEIWKLMTSHQFFNWPPGSLSNGSHIILIWLCLQIY